MKSLFRPSVSAPAVWGKLPSHGDYIRHRVGFKEADRWQDWLLRELGERAFKAHSSSRRAPQAAGPWIALERPAMKPGPGQVPIAFALPSQALHHEIAAQAIGVIARSEDSRGRAHPLIVYQFCSAQWLRQCFARSLTESHEVTLGWLYWLSRLVVRYLDSQAQAVMPLPQAVDELWSAFAPGWLQGLGIQRKAPDPKALTQWLQTAGLPEAPEPDAMQMLHGVRHLPWLDWPDRIWLPDPGPHPASMGTRRRGEAVKSYWQHDAAGGYVGAASQLSELWN